MMTKPLRAMAAGLAVITLSVTLAVSPALAESSFTGLGILPGGTFSTASIVGGSLSRDGSTAVGWSGTPNDIEAFRWTSDDGMVGLGDLPGDDIFSKALGTNADGSVVVGTSGVEAFRWTSGGGMVGLGDLPGGGPTGGASFFSKAFGTTADGSVVVGKGTQDSGGEAFRWTSGGGMVGLGDLPGGVFSSHAFAINADGSVVVGSGESASGTEAFRWTSGGGMVGLGDLPGGGFSSFANATNPDGSVIVGQGNSDMGAEAYRWTSSGGMVGLGVLPGDSVSTSYGTNADGSVVVGESSSGAFIWDQTNLMRSLVDVLIDDFGLDLTGWHLTRASGISDDGLVVTGFGTNPDGFQEAWIASMMPIDPLPEETIMAILEDLEAIVDANPGSVVADKVEDASSLVDKALEELAKIPADDQAAMGAIEGAVGDLEAALGLDPELDAEIEMLRDSLVAAGRGLAQSAVELAIEEFGDPVVIAEAQQFLDQGDILRDSGAAKDAAAEYKNALAKAESA